jgi:hypothetical protein
MQQKAIDRVMRSISTHISMSAANVEEMPAQASKLGITGSDHFFLRFERLAFAGDGHEHVRTEGVSSRALIELRDLTSAEYACISTRSALLSKHGTLLTYKMWFKW